MKTALLLRQQVPVDKERIAFNSLEEVDDMWIHLFNLLCKKMKIDSAQIWMWGGGPREVTYQRWDPLLVERWWPSFPLTPRFDFIFSRGGFPEYVPVMKANPQAFKLYYGAIYKARFNPSANQDATKYSLLLADSNEQQSQLSKAGYNAIKFYKPAAENIFYPYDCPKKYDVVFIGNSFQPFKGCEWFINKMKGSKLKLLFIGAVHPEMMILAKKNGLDATFTGYVRRREIRTLVCQAKIGVCCSESDSSPRIIPEMLAMNIPVVIRKTDKLFYHAELLNTQNLVMVDEAAFVEVLNTWVIEYIKLDAREFYVSNLSLNISTDLLAFAIKGGLKKPLARPQMRI